MLAIALWLPELGSLAHSDELAWRVYLTAQQVVSAVLCLALSARKGWASTGVAGAVWFTTQAADEWTNGNLWKEQQWEYPLALALMLAAWLLRKTERS